MSTHSFLKKGRKHAATFHYFKDCIKKIWKFTKDLGGHKIDDAGGWDVILDSGTGI
ncbi:hypothetical protein [Bacillus albus]|uniref:hypothetical protein n=1 Tax=Bacillus albus TaxID=2026189 RepID=UPI003D2100E0